jgi:hypothetical protein
MAKPHDLLEERVILAPDYRVFLKESFEVLRAKKPGFSLTVFANKAGMGSRGFILDVVRGEKRLTARSAPKAIRGLGLSGKLKSLFLALIEQSEPDFSLVKSSPADLASRVQRLRTELQAEKRQGIGPKKIAPASLYADINFLIIYSALGSLEVGASREQILERTGLPARSVDFILEKMCAEGIVALQGDRFMAINSHIVFENLGKESSFQKVFLESLKIVRDRAAKEMDGDDRLFFHSVVPIKKDRLPQLKASLKSAMTEFVHENQNDDEGDHVAMLQLAFF